MIDVWVKIGDIEINRKGEVIDFETKSPKVAHDNGGGYKHVTYNKGKSREYIHRLVAKTFIPNPEGLKYVGHKDHNKDNNDVSNLYWTEASQNTLDGVKAGRINYKGRYKNGMVRHPVETICSVYVEVKQGSGLMETSRKYGVNRTTAASWVNKKSKNEVTDILDEMMNS